MLQKILKRNNQLFFIILWTSLWLSIGTFPTEKPFFNQNLSLNDLIFKIRTYSPIILLFFLIILIFLKKINLEFNEKKFTFLFILIFIFQGIGLILNEERTLEFSNWYLILYAILSIFVTSNLSLESLKKIQFLNLFFIVLAFVIFIFPVYKTFFDFNNFNLYMYYNKYWEDSSFGSPNARVTGIARYCLVIIIFLYSYQLTCNKKNLHTFLFLFLIFFFFLNIWMLQSRLVIGSLILVFFSSLIIKNKKFNNIKIIFFFILISITVFYSFSKFQKFKLNLILEKKFEQLEKNEKDKEIDKFIDNLDNAMSSRLGADNSSGRTTIWKKLINTYDKTKIFGYGSQADRAILINKKDERNLDNNASNAILYTFASGGYLAMICFIIMLFFTLILNYKILIKNYHGFSLNFFDLTAFLLINFLLIRQLFENSFAVFSLDLLIFLTNYFYLTRRLEK